MRGVQRYLALCVLLLIGAEAKDGPPAPPFGWAASLEPESSTRTYTVPAGHDGGGGGAGTMTMAATDGANTPAPGDEVYDTDLNRFGTCGG